MVAARRMLLAAVAAGAARWTTANPAEATGFDESMVVNIQPEDFDEQIKKLAPVLVDFYACVPRGPRTTRTPDPATQPGW